MDTRKEILTRVLAALEAQGIATATHDPAWTDEDTARIHLHYDGRELRLHAAVWPRLTQQTLGLAIDGTRRLGKAALLVTDYVTPAMAERLREHEVLFADTAGNAYLRGPGLLAWVKGQRAQRMRTVAAAPGRAFEPGGLKVLLAMLCNPGLVKQPYRAIAAEAGVAHGTVGWVMEALPDLGYLATVERTGRKVRRLLQPDKLLTQWAEAYIRVLRPKLALGRYEFDAAAAAAIPDWAAYQATLGGEYAGQRLTRYLKPATLTLYTPAPQPRLLIDLRLRLDPNGRMEILRKFWRWADEPGAVDLAPLPVVYADLIAAGDARTLETAQLIREQFVARFFEQERAALA